MSELIQFDGRTVAIIAPEDLEQMEAEIERLRKELAGADRIANDWAKQNVELRRLLRFFFENVPVQYYEGYADVMKRTEEILWNR